MLHNDIKSRDKFIKRFEETCYKFANKVVITYLLDDSEITFTYRELLFEVKRYSKKINNIISKGYRVAILSELSPYCYIAFLAIVYTGATAVIIDPELPNPELKRLLSSSGVHTILLSDTIYSKVFEDIKNDFNTINIENAETYSKAITKDLSFQLSTDDEAAILFSSGTTSDKKGVVIPFESELNSAKYLLDIFGTNRIKYLLVFPFFHISGFSVFIALLLGGGEIGLIHNFNSHKLLESFHRFKPNSFGMVPKVFETFQQKITNQIKETKGVFALKLINFSGFLRRVMHINLGKYLFKPVNNKVFGGNLKYIGVGGGMAKKETAEFFLNLGYKWMNTYASTEANLPIVSTTYKDNYSSESLGNIDFCKNIKIKTININNNGIGEIAVKSDTIMKCYLNDNYATKQAFTDDGYFRTGDLGYIKNNKLYMTGREKESIHLSNGEKISPEDVEIFLKDIIPQNTIYACSGVKCNDENYDKTVIFIEKNDSINFDSVRKSILANNTFACINYKVDEVVLIDKMPINSLGKLQRYKLSSMNVFDDKTPNFNDKKVLTVSDIIKKYISKDIKLTDSAKIKSDLGLDSLSLLNICVEIDDLYNISIEEYLKNDMTITELNELISFLKSSESSCNTTEYQISDFPMKKTIFSLIILRILMRFFRITYKFECSGKDNLFKFEKFIITANHQTHLDSLWIFSFLRKKQLKNVCCLAKKEHLDNNSSKFFLKMLGGIPVDRYDNSIPALKRCVEVLKNDKSILLIHPEGTRTNNGELGEFKNGAAELSARTGVPIVPVSIKGGYEIFNKKMKRPKLFDFKHFRRFKLYFEIGEPIFTKGGKVSDITEQVKEVINIEKFPELRNHCDFLNFRIKTKMLNMIYNLHIDNAFKLPENENYIICSNHQSYIDPFVILTAMKISKEDYFNTVCLSAIHTSYEKKLKKNFKLLGGIPVDRDGNTTPSLKRAINCVNQKKNLIIFPEGKRTRDGSIMNFQDGASIIAKQTNTKILPITISGAFEIYPRTKNKPLIFNWRKMKRYNIHIAFHNPISPTDLSIDNITTILKETINNGFTIFERKD